MVTDAYLLLFLPMVANMLPQLEVIPKNADGEPVPLDKIGQLIICRDDGRELKVWEVMLIYAAQLSGEDGVSRIPDYYAGVAGRITKTWTFPLVGWLLFILAVIMAGIIYLVFRMRRRRKSRDTIPI